MKLKGCVTPHSTPPLLLGLLLSVGLFSGSNTAKAAPRLPGPPWPEINSLFHIGFDEPLSWPTNQTIDSALYAESWSGYALSRTGTFVQPYVLPMLSSDATWQINPLRGAIRLWFKPNWSSLSSGQGAGPGNAACLATLVSASAGGDSLVWALSFNAAGSSLQLTCQSPSGPEVCMSAPVSLQAGTWHLFTLGYTETNCALFLDDQELAVGNGLPPVSTNTAPQTRLVLGSDANGFSVVGGQLEEVYTFTGTGRFHQQPDCPYGLTPEWEIAYYYQIFSPLAAKGPVTETEIAQEQALRSKRLAQKATASLSKVALAPTDFQTSLYDPSQGFWLSTPQIVQGTNFSLTLVNGDPSISYDIYSSPSLAPTDWRIVATGHIAQTAFTLSMPDSMGFFRGAVGGDWDGDGIPNGLDANPTNAAIGILNITIESPSTGSSLN